MLSEYTRLICCIREYFRQKAINLGLDIPKMYATTLKKVIPKTFQCILALAHKNLATRRDCGWIVSQEVKTIHF